MALVSSIAPVAGAAAPAAAGMLALRTSMGLVKAAGMGVEESFDGMFDEFQKATPASNALASTVKGMVPELLSLKNAAQGRILGGVSDGIASAEPLIGKLRPSLLETSTALGSIAREAGFVGNELGGELAPILSTNAGLIKNVGFAGINMAVVLVRILSAARPLTAWIGRLALGWSKSAMSAANAGTQSGKLAGFFDKTRLVMSRLGRIMADVAVGLFNIGKAGAPLGDSLLVSIVRGAEAFKDWTASASGQNALLTWFANAKPVIHETAGLVGDVALALGRIGLSSSGGLAPMIHDARALVPILESVVGGTMEAFGPALVDMLVAFAQALAPLAGSSGPLILFVQGLTLVASAIAWVVQNVPGAGVAISTLAGALAVARVATLGYGAAVAVAARLGMVYRAGLVAVGLALRGAALAQRLLNGAMRMNPIGLVITALIALGLAFVVLWKKSQTFRTIVTGAWNGIKAAASAVVSWFSGAAGTVGRFFSHIGGGAASAFRSVKKWLGDVVTFLAGLPGRVLEAAKSIGKTIIDGIVDGIKSAPGAIVDAIDQILPGPIKDLVGGGAGLVSKVVPGLATGGTVTSAGLTWVGERGPELLTLPAGARVTDHRTSMRLASAPASIGGPRPAGAGAGSANYGPAPAGDVHVYIDLEEIMVRIERRLRKQMAITGRVALR